MRATLRFLQALRYQFGFNIISWFIRILCFFHSYYKYGNLPKNINTTQKVYNLYPCLTDSGSTVLIEPTYFYQNTWAAKKIFLDKPLEHVDVGSSVNFMGVLSQCIPTIIIDIRRPNVEFENLSFEYGSIINLPFSDNEVLSLSSLCVIEHIGLGRYGDDLDAWGTEKAANELSRVLKVGGNLYISVPVDDENRIYFNAHRAFTRDYAIELFAGLELIEEAYVYGDHVYENYDSTKGFGTGLYHFHKKQ